MQDTASCITPTLLIAILHPHGVPHLKGKIGQLALIATIGIHEPQLLTAAAVRHKDNLRPIRRPGGVFVPGPFIIGELHGRPLAFAHQPQLIVATLVGDKDDHIGRGRPAGIPGMAGAKAGEGASHFGGLPIGLLKAPGAIAQLWYAPGASQFGGNFRTAPTGRRSDKSCL